MGLQDTQRAIAKFQVKVKVAKACHFSFSFFCLFDTYIRTYKNNNARQFQKEREAAMTKKTKTIEEILNWWNIGNYCTLEDGLAFHFTFDGSNWSNAERVPDKQLTALILQLKWKRLGTIGEQPNGGGDNMEDQTWRIIPEYLVRIFRYAFLHVDRISGFGWVVNGKNGLQLDFVWPFSIEMWNRMLPMDKNDNDDMATSFPRQQNWIKIMNATKCDWDTVVFKNTKGKLQSG